MSRWDGSSYSPRRFLSPLLGGAISLITRRIPALFALVALTVPAGSQPPKEKTDKISAAGTLIEVHLNDDGHLKMKLLDEKIELLTPYGKLVIPAADIRRIEFATRIPEDVAKKIDAAIANLGKDDFAVREAAADELRGFGAAAYPALLEAARSKDAEVKRRADELLTKLRETFSEERLAVRAHDVIHTADSKLTGRISASSLKVNTAQFGELQMKLSDVRSLNAPGAGEEVADNGPIEPWNGDLGKYAGNIGKSYRFRITGNVSGSLWGSDVYTTDSTLEMAAVHAGVLKNGQTGVVKVTIVDPPPTFAGTTRNGVTSSPYMAYPSAFKVSK